MMRIGISIGTTFSSGGPAGDREGPRYVLSQARAAARASLDTLSLGDHHSTAPAAYVQNVPMLGRILAEWTDRPLGCLFLIPLWHPVLMAEQIGTLAAMSSGPFIVQTGLGGGEEQFRAMGVDIRERGARLEEGIRIAQALLRGETVSSQAYAVDAARIAPIAPDGTEWWVGGVASKAIDRAARLGDCWYAARAISVYKEACVREGREPVRVPLRKDVFIAESQEEAEKVGNALIDRGYRGFDRTAVAYGDPENVAEQLAVFGVMGFTDIIIRTMSPLPPELGPNAAARSVELAGEVQSLLA
jgi:alkanesulfonate monooxygenase SsuD/methylene tetrahydromethanopterin reductase-like flavin-dependent oxidoreductase (luciferase family)